MTFHSDLWLTPSSTSPSTPGSQFCSIMMSVGVNISPPVDTHVTSYFHTGQKGLIQIQNSLKKYWVKCLDHREYSDHFHCLFEIHAHFVNTIGITKVKSFHIGILNQHSNTLSSQIRPPWRSLATQVLNTGPLAWIKMVCTHLSNPQTPMRSIPINLDHLS